MHFDGEFIGRDREAAQLDLSIGPGDDGLRLALLSGPSGLGKTTLSAVAAERAVERGFRAAMVRGRAGSLSTPFAPFIEAMPEFEALLSVLAYDQSIDIEHAGIGLVNLLAELTVDRPLLLVFDDAQALDESSIALLPYIAGVAERMNITLFFIEQTDAIGVASSYRAFIDGLLARRVVSHLELGPMSDDSIRELIAHVLGTEDPAQVPGEVVLRAQGNPWFAKELAESFTRGDAEIPTSIAAAATARLHTLDEAGQDVVYAAAICPEGAHIGWLEAMSGQQPRAFVRMMEAIDASGLVREDGEVVTIAHPLMQQALVDELSAAMRRAMHTELAAVIAEVPLPEVVSARALGYHLGSAGKPDEAVAQYLRAAQANELLGQLHEAYVDLAHALDAEPRMAGRIDLLKRCASMSMQLGTNHAVGYWTELGRIAAANGDDELYAYSLFQQYWACNDGTANERLQHAATLGADTYGWSALAAATIARMQGDHERSIQHDRRAIEIAQANADGILEAYALQKLANSLADLGTLDEAIETYRMAIQRAISLRLHDWVVISWGAMVETYLDDLQVTTALTEIDAAITYADDLGLDRALPALLTWRSSALLRAGDLSAAASEIDRAFLLDARFGNNPAFRADHFSALVRMLRAEIGNDMGAADSEERSRTALEQVTQLGYASWEASARFEQARMLARTSNIDAALAALPSLTAEDEPALVASVATWLTRYGTTYEAPAALEAARQLDAHIDAADGTLAALTKRELAATFAAVDGGDLAELHAVAASWAEHQRVLDALRVQLVIASILMSRGAREDARPILEETKRGLQACHADPDTDRAASLLRQTGARSRAKSRTTNVGPLTKRELEIARLVASGLKNSEVAGTLFLAEKTVAAHLSNIYGKVEVRSRVQLTAWIREHDIEFDSAMAQAAAG